MDQEEKEESTTTKKEKHAFYAVFCFCFLTSVQSAKRDMNSLLRRREKEMCCLLACWNWTKENKHICMCVWVSEENRGPFDACFTALSFFLSWAKTCKKKYLRSIVLGVGHRENIDVQVIYRVFFYVDGFRRFSRLKKYAAFQ